MEQKFNSSGSITVYQPFFDSFVFVLINENEITSEKKIPDMINMVNWKSKPTIIDQEEINTTRMMTNKFNILTY